MGRATADEPPLPDLAALLAKHATGLRGAVRSVLGARADVPEVLQDGVAKACEALSRGVRPRDPVGWLYVIVLNVARDQRRRRRRDAMSLEELPAVTLETLTTNQSADPRAGLERAEALAAARDAIAALRDPEKDVFLLRTSAELSYEDAAATLGIPVGTAKTRMRAALARLRVALATHAPEARRVVR